MVEDVFLDDGDLFDFLEDVAGAILSNVFDDVMERVTRMVLYPNVILIGIARIK